MKPLVILILFISTFSCSQKTIKPSEGLNVPPDFTYFTDSTNSLNPVDILNRDMEKRFKSLPKNNFLNSKYNQWFKFTVDTIEANSPRQVLIASKNEMCYLYHDGLKIKLQETKPNRLFCFDLDSKPGNYFLKIVSKVYYTPSSPTLLEVTFISRKILTKLFDETKLTGYNNLLWMHLFLIINLFLILFTFFQWLIHRDKTYLYYCIYIISLTLFYLIRENNKYGISSEWITANRDIIARVFVAGAGIGYFLFTFSFLGINKQNHPLLSKMKTATIAILILFGLIFTMSPILGFMNISIYKYCRNTLLIVVAPIVFVQFAKLRTPLKYYILTGTAVIIIFGVIGMINEFTSNHYGYKIEVLGLSYIQIGALLEFLVFSTGLGYKTKIINQEKVVAQNELIIQLENNQSLQNELTQKLKLENEKLDIERKLTQVELKLLKAQINPHFLFNSFNSLKDLIQQEKSKEAIEYLEKFTKMMRGVLSGSDKQTQSLSEELDFSANYVAMESLRFGKKIEFHINVIEGLLHNEVPTLILQPLLENSIWHGLLHKQGDRKLIINCYGNDQGLIIEIIDNGAGLGRVENSMTKTSFGLKLVQDRLKIYLKSANLELFNKIENNEIIGAIARISLPNP